MFQNLKSKIENCREGFTLLEITIAIAIVVAIGAAALASFVHSRNIRNLTAAGQDVLSTLRDAQERALSGRDTSQWGVHFTQNNFTLFRGTNFASSTSTELHTLPAGIEIVNIAFAGGGADVIFKRMSGETDQTGSFTARVATATSNVFFVSIDASGKVYQTETPPASAGSRIVDARHRLFNLGWSIQSASALTLTFSDPPGSDTVSSIPMAPFFNADKSVFDWSGTVSVGGRDQVLRIHTTVLTGSATTLSVDRDCRFNSKKVKISIDGKDIATYEADCSAITVGSFGGTMTEL